MKILFIIYDNGSHIPFFPQGVAYLAAKLHHEGHEIEYFHQDITHQKEEALTQRIEWEGLTKGEGYDVVALGFVAGYYQYQKAKLLAEAVNKCQNRSDFKFILGGHGPSADPGYFRELLGADAVFEGEAEKTITGWVQSGCPASGGLLFSDSLPVHPDNTPWPLYEDFPIDVYSRIRWPTSKPEDLCMPILSGRGCPYKCTFCYRMEEGRFAPRAPDAVIEEMFYLHHDHQINHFQFSDELFMSSPARIAAFCEHMLSSWRLQQIPGFKWDCNGRLNFAKPDTLKLMKRAGCEYINYGCEAMDDQVLKNLNKGLTVEQIKKGVRATLDADIVPGLNFMWGSPGDDFTTLKKAVEFLLNYDTCHELRTIRPVTPYPGSALFQEAIDQGLLKNTADFYENKHVNSDLLTVNFTEYSDEEFHRHLHAANRQLIGNYYGKQQRRTHDAARRLYSGDTSFRGFRTV